MWRGLTSAPHAVLRSELFLPSCVISFIHLRLPRQIAYYNLLSCQNTIARKAGDHVMWWCDWCLDSWKIWSGLFSQPSEAHTMVGKKLMMAVRLATIALLFISEPSDTAVMSEIFLLLYVSSKSFNSSHPFFRWLWRSEWNEYGALHEMGQWQPATEGKQSLQ